MAYMVGDSSGVEHLGVSRPRGSLTVIALFYPTLTIVIASYYGLFAVIRGSASRADVGVRRLAAFLLLSLRG